jgi:hypothetical protein
MQGGSKGLYGNCPARSIAISWFVDQKRIWRRGAPNNNAVGGMGLVL